MFSILNYNIANADNSQWFRTHRVTWINLTGIGDEPEESDEALQIAIRVINRILSLTSLIAIIVFLVWWYKVLTAWWDDSKVKAWYKIIKNAIIWLLIIWLTRAAVRLIFWFVNWMAWLHDFDSDW